MSLIVAAFSPIVGIILPTTWNSGDKAAGVTLSNGDLTASSATNNHGVRSIYAIANNQKLYCEGTVGDDGGAPGIIVGAVEIGATITDNMAGFNDATTYREDGVFFGDFTDDPTPAIYDAADVVMLAVSRVGTTIKVWLGLNGTWQPRTGPTSPDPATGADPTDTMTLVSAIHVAMSTRFATAEVTMNFGASAFSHTVPTDFSAGWGAAA